MTNAAAVELKKNEVEIDREAAAHAEVVRTRQILDAIDARITAFRSKNCTSLHGEAKYLIKATDFSSAASEYKALIAEAKNLCRERDRADREFQKAVTVWSEIKTTR